MSNRTRTPFGLGHPWFETLLELKRGEFPTKEALAFGLRSSEPVPPSVREFLAQLVGGDMRRPKKRPKRSLLVIEVNADAARLTYEFMLERAQEARAAGEHFHGTPSEVAMEWTQQALADRNEHLSIDSIRDMVRGRKGSKQG